MFVYGENCHWVIFLTARWSPKTSSAKACSCDGLEALCKSWNLSENMWPGLIPSGSWWKMIHKSAQSNRTVGCFEVIAWVSPQYLMFVYNM